MRNRALCMCKVWAWARARAGRLNATARIAKCPGKPNMSTSMSSRSGVLSKDDAVLVSPAGGAANASTASGGSCGGQSPRLAPQRLTRPTSSCRPCLPHSRRVGFFVRVSPRRLNRNFGQDSVEQLRSARKRAPHTHKRGIKDKCSGLKATCVRLALSARGGS